MTFFGDLTFFIYLSLALIPAVILGFIQKPIKLYSFFLSIFFILIIYGNDFWQMVYLSVFILAELHVIKIYLFIRKKIGRNSIVYGHFVLLACSPLLIYKIAGLFDGNIFGFLGISYLTFKAVQIIIESYDGVIKEIKIFDLLSFLLFFPTISSGPIDRSRRFSENLEKTYNHKEYAELVGKGLQKLLLGAAYKFVFSSVFFSIMNSHIGVYQFSDVVMYTYSYGFYLFFDFAGYSLMAVGTSYILGITTPDNFKWPFISVDIKDFWNRWHITLSYWFRDFVFSRFMMDSIKKKRFSSRLSGASIAFIVNMLVMGFWHGLSFHYILYGLYHGILLALTEIFQKKSKLYAKYKNNKLYKIVSWVVTMQLVMFGFLIFSGEFGNVINAFLIQIR